DARGDGPQPVPAHDPQRIEPGPPQPSPRCQKRYRFDQIGLTRPVLARQHHMPRIEIERRRGIVAEAGEPEAGNGAVGWGHYGLDGLDRCAGAAHPSSDLSLFKRKPTFSLKGRRGAPCSGAVKSKRPQREPPSPLEGEGMGVRGAPSLPKSPRPIDVTPASASERTGLWSRPLP